jgi:hypothetical protein
VGGTAILAEPGDATHLLGKVSRQVALLDRKTRRTILLMSLCLREYSN